MNLNQITIPVTDVKKSVQFYTTFGCQIIVDSSPRYVRFECSDGNSTFSLHSSQKVEAKNGVIIYFEVSNVDETCNQLKRKGLQFEQDPEDMPWLWREAWLRDPDGYKIIVYYAGENRLNPPWKVMP